MPTFFADLQVDYNSVVPNLENLEGKAKKFYSSFLAPLIAKCARRHLRRQQGYSMKKKRICETVKRLRELFIQLDGTGRGNNWKINDISPEIRQIIKHDDGDNLYGHYSNSLLYSILEYMFPEDQTTD
jgi:hypothetical protein